MTAISRDVGDSGDTLRPSACVPSARYPPPIGAVLKTNAKPQFDRTVDRAVEALFRLVCLVESVSFWRSFHPCNPLPTHGSAVGRNCHRSCRRPKAEALSVVEGDRRNALASVFACWGESRETNDLKPKLRIVAVCRALTAVC